MNNESKSIMSIINKREADDSKVPKKIIVSTN